MKFFFVFLDKSVLNECCSFWLVKTNYLSSAIYVFKNSPKVSDLTENDIFLVNLSQNMKHLGKMLAYRFTDFSSVWDSLKISLQKSVLIQHFLNILVTTSFVVKNFRNTWAIRLNYFPKWSMFYVDFKYAKKNWWKVSFFRQELKMNAANSF